MRRKKPPPPPHFFNAGLKKLFFPAENTDSWINSDNWWGGSAFQLSPSCLRHPQWLITWLGFNSEGWDPHGGGSSSLHLPHLPISSLWKTVIGWVYVVRLINHINLYLLVGWLRAMTIRLMKLVNSSNPQPTHTQTHTQMQTHKGKNTKRKSVMTKLAIKIGMLIECRLLLMIGL